MRSSALRWLRASSFALADAAVLMAPSVVLASTADKGGIGGLHGFDLLLASAVVATLHGALVFTRLSRRRGAAARHLDLWIATFDGIVVLALSSTLLLVGVLGGFADTHAVLVNRGWWVVWLWLGVQLLAVALAEVTGRAVLRWLQRARPRARAAVPSAR